MPSALAGARRGLFEIYRKERRQEWIQASGQSMRPLIRSGSWMLVDFGALPRGVGDVVVFARGETIVAHRVVGRLRPHDAATLMTKGDARLTFDPPLARSDVIGVVRALRRDQSSRARSIGCRGGSAVLAGTASQAIGRIVGRLHVLGPRR